MMERFTKRDEQGVAFIGKYGEPPYPVITPEALERLAAYEDTGLEPEQICNGNATVMAAYEMCAKHSPETIIRRLKEILIAEAEGRLVVLPCKVGDTLFFVMNGEIYSGVVRVLYWKHSKIFGVYSEVTASTTQNATLGASFNDFGKTVFLTREEAEKALEGMK